MLSYDLFEETHLAKHDNNDDLKNEAEKRENPDPNRHRGNHPETDAPTTYRLAGRAGTCVGRVNFIAPGNVQAR